MPRHPERSQHITAIKCYTNAPVDWAPYEQVVCTRWITIQVCPHDVLNLHTHVYCGTRSMRPWTRFLFALDAKRHAQGIPLDGDKGSLTRRFGWSLCALLDWSRVSRCPSLHSWTHRRENINMSYGRCVFDLILCVSYIIKITARHVCVSGMVGLCGHKSEQNKCKL